jgi:heme-degrading monooxygenase HmoA
LNAWANDAAYLRSQPGFISAQLHLGIGSSTLMINFAVWESTAHLKEALSNVDVEPVKSISTTY